WRRMHVMKTPCASGRTGRGRLPARRRRARWALALALLLGLVGLGVRWSRGEGTVGRPMPDEGRGHVAPGSPVMYEHYPPTSGHRWPSPAPWGVFEQEVPPETWVHNLEHGGIVILYHCGTPCPDLGRQLRDVYATFPGSKFGHVKLLVTPASRL